MKTQHTDKGRGSKVRDEARWAFWIKKGRYVEDVGFSETGAQVGDTGVGGCCCFLVSQQGLVLVRALKLGPRKWLLGFVFSS